jgi:eukaryotic-like serine/threonine-protein kinase
MVEQGGPVGPPPPEGPPPGMVERDLWPWLLGLLILVIAGILLAYFLTRGGGHKTNVVPDVKGQTEARAAKRLHQTGFQVNVRNVFSPRTGGTVITEDPRAGSKLSRGDTVTLIVSQGRKQVAVPNVLGLSQAEAVSQLTKAGLNSSVVLVPNSVPAGRVVSQAPTQGTKLNPGSTVRLNVSKGRKQTTTVTKTVTNTQTRTQATTTTQPTTTVVTTTSTSTATVPATTTTP